jgi:polar amino acid transport system permease protein
MTGPTVSKLGEGDDTLPELYRSGRAKQRRARRSRLTAYTVGAAILVVIVVFADWGKIGDKYFNGEIARDMFPDVITIAAKNTVVYTLFSFAGGVVLGLTMALLRLSSIRVYRAFAATYIDIFRGLPALLTIILVGFMTPIALGIHFPTLFGVPTGGIVALALVAGAYLAETIRSGIEAVPRGQVEAARSLGMTHAQTLRKIVIPQAFRIIIPPLTNELVLLLKDTSLLAILGVTITQKELTKFAQSDSSRTFNGTPLVVAGAIYLIITIPLTRLVSQLEKRNRAIR